MLFHWSEIGKLTGSLVLTSKTNQYSNGVLTLKNANATNTKWQSLREHRHENMSVGTPPQLLKFARFPIVCLLNYRLFWLASGINKMNTRNRGRRSNTTARPNPPPNHGRFRIIIVEVGFCVFELQSISLNNCLFRIFRQPWEMKSSFVLRAHIESMSFNTTRPPLCWSPSMKMWKMSQWRRTMSRWTLWMILSQTIRWLKKSALLDQARPGISVALATIKWVSSWM